MLWHKRQEVVYAIILAGPVASISTVLNDAVAIERERWLPVRTENLIRVDDVTESLKLVE